MKKLLYIIAIVAVLAACGDKNAQVGSTVEVKSGDSTVTAVVIDPNAPTTSKFQPTGDMEKDAEFLVAQGCMVTPDMLNGTASEEDINAANQMLLDAMKYYQDLDKAKGEQFMQLVSKKLLEHAKELQQKQ